MLSASSRARFAFAFITRAVDGAERTKGTVAEVPLSCMQDINGMKRTLGNAGYIGEGYNVYAVRATTVVALGVLAHRADSLVSRVALTAIVVALL